MVTRRTVMAACAAVVIALATASWGYTWTPNKSMRLSFSGPVALPGVTLQAGTYIFERVSDDVHVVRVSSADQKTVYLTVFTHLVERPAGLALERPIMLGEAKAGMAPQIKAWYPSSSERMGNQFIYDER